MTATLKRSKSVTLANGGYPPVTVPRWATESLSSFREWAGDNDLPENSRVFYYRGEIMIELGKEQLYTHVSVKTEITSVLYQFVKTQELGYVFSDGVLVTNEKAELSGNPDAVFVSRESISNGRVTLVAGAEGGFVELLGSPDMVLEVVSDSSVKKDKQTLFGAYFAAGIRIAPSVLFSWANSQSLRGNALRGSFR